MLQHRPHTLKGHRWTLLLQLMVYWCSTEPCPPGEAEQHITRACVASWDSRCKSTRTLSLTISTPIIRPFPRTSPMISYLSRSFASSVMRWVPTSRLFFCRPSSLTVCKGDANFRYNVQQTVFLLPHRPIPQQRAAKNRWTSRWRISPHIQHRRSDSAGHRVSSEGVEVDGLVKRGCNFCKTRGNGDHTYLLLGNPWGAKKAFLISLSRATVPSQPPLTLPLAGMDKCTI